MLLSATPKGDKCKLHESHQSEANIKPGDLHYVGSIKDNRVLLDVKSAWAHMAGQQPFSEMAFVTDKTCSP